MRRTSTRSTWIWCLQCHREPEKHTSVPREEVFNLDYEAQA